VRSPTPSQRYSDALKRASDYRLQSLADETRTSYTKDYDEFARWCRSMSLEAATATEIDLAVFAASLCDTISVATIKRKVSAVRTVRSYFGRPIEETGELKRILAGIKRQHGKPAVGKAGLSPEQLTATLEALPDTRAGRRDRALILVGAYGALRRSDLVALEVGDLQIDREGCTITIPRSKTDPDGDGETIALRRKPDRQFCPVTSLEIWLRTAGIRSGPIFRGMTKHDTVRASRLSKSAVGEILKARVRAGLEALGLGETAISALVEQVGSHSLRVTLITQAARGKVDIRDLKAHTRHAKTETLNRYVRRASAQDWTPTRTVDLTASTAEKGG